MRIPVRRVTERPDHHGMPIGNVLDLVLDLEHVDATTIAVSTAIKLANQYGTLRTD